jgi:hypothetical protein
MTARLFTQSMRVRVIYSREFKRKRSFHLADFEFAHPISNGSLFFTARTPAGTSLSFQVRAGKTLKELESADFSGPDAARIVSTMRIICRSGRGSLAARSSNTGLASPPVIRRPHHS